MCIVLPYVELVSSQIVAFLECDGGVTGEALADMILQFVNNHLDSSKLRGQAYDGASNMSGKTKGAAVHIYSQYPLALYTHCASHYLNLVVVASFEKTSVRNTINIVNRLSTFFLAHPKWQKKKIRRGYSRQPTRIKCSKAKRREL